MIQFINKEFFYNWLAEIKKTGITKEDKHFLSDMRIAPFYKCKLLMIFDEDKGASVLCYTVTRKYINIYYQYTIPTHRRKGYTGRLVDEVIKIEKGNFDRIYVRASTPEIVAYYDKKEYKFFGTDKDGSQLRELWFDNDSRPAKSLKYII